MKEHTDGIGVDFDIRKLSKERSTLKSEGELGQAVLQQLADQAGKRVLTVVDVERKAQDPADLKVVAVE